MHLEVLQQLLGHQDIEMTKHYARITNRTREQEYFKAVDLIEQGGNHEICRLNTQRPKVFEKEKLLGLKRK